MRVAFLSQYFPPEMGAPQRRIGELAHRFRDAGHDVSVLTAMPNYPTGEVFRGYGGAMRVEDLDGIRVIRSWIYPSQSASVVPRLLSYGSFVASSAVVGALSLRDIDYLVVESPPLFLGLSGMWLGRVTGARVVFNVSDLWPESAVQVGVVSRESRAFRAAEELEAACYRSAWLVTGQSRSTVASIVDRFPEVATYHLSNGCDTESFGSRFATGEVRDVLDPSGTSFVSVYAGLHGLAQGLSQILDAAERLRGTPHRFVLIGDGPEKKALMADARARDLSNVVFMEPVRSEEVPRLLASADAILVTLKSEILGAVPSKIYEAMASERPLVLVDCGEAATIVSSAGAGCVVAPGDVPSLVDALERLRSDEALRSAMGERGRAVAVARYDRREIAGRFIARLEEGLSS